MRRCSAVLGGMQGIMDDNKQANARDKLSYIYLCCPKGKPNTISTSKFGYPHFTLKVGPKVKSEHIKRFLAHDFL